MTQVNSVSAIVGMISFQSNDQLDVFQVLEVQQSGISPSMESLLGIEDTQFESDRAWVTGCVPKLIPVDVDGDTTVIHSWFRAETFDKSFVLRIYVEFEEVEAVIEGEASGDNKCEQPKEIFL